MSALACSMSMLGWVPSLTHRMQLFPGAVAVLKWSIYLNRITPDLYASNKSGVKSVSFPWLEAEIIMFNSVAGIKPLSSHSGPL